MKAILTITSGNKDPKNFTRDIELTLIGKERRIRGHTLFSYNIITGEIKVADVQYSKEVDFMTREPTEKPKLVIEPNCIYRQALNKKKFIKRLKREGIL